MTGHRKSTIIIFLHPEVSGYNASFRLARELKAKGHRIIYAGDSRARFEGDMINIEDNSQLSFQKYVTDQGFEFKVIELDDQVFQGEMARQRRILEEFGTTRKWRRKRLQVRMLNLRSFKFVDHMMGKAERWSQEVKPDLVLMDQFCMYGALPFLKSNIKIIGINTSLASTFSWESPPTFSRIKPDTKKGLKSYIKNLMAWAKIYLWHLTSIFTQNLLLLFAFGFSFNQRYSVKKRIRQYGGKLQWGEYGTLRLKVPELVMAPVELEFPFNRETSLRCYAGSCVDLSRNPGGFDWTPLEPNKPLIYCSIGSHPDYVKKRIDFYREVIEAIIDRPEIQAIIQIRYKEERELFSPSPGNIFIYSWVPQLEVLDRASVFLTHGGLSSVRESIYKGVPMIVFPWGVDQPGNAARVEFHHLGLSQPLNEANQETIGEKIDNILQDKTYSESIKKMQKEFLQQEDCKKGVQFVESFL